MSLKKLHKPKIVTFFNNSENKCIEHRNDSVWDKRTAIWNNLVKTYTYIKEYDRYICALFCS